MKGRTVVIALHRAQTFLHMGSPGPVKSSWYLLKQFAPQNVPDDITVYAREVFKPSLKWVEAGERKRKRALGRYSFFREIINTVIKRCEIKPKVPNNLQHDVAAWTAKRFRYSTRVIDKSDMNFFDNMRRTKQDSERGPVPYGIWDSAIVGCLTGSPRGPKFTKSMSQVKLTYANRPEQEMSPASKDGRPKDIDFVIIDGSSKGQRAYGRDKRHNGLMALGNILSGAKRSVMESFHAFANDEALDFLFVTPDSRALSIAEHNGWHPLFLIKDLGIDRKKKKRFDRRILKLREETFPALDFASEQQLVHGILGLDALKSWKPLDEKHQVPGAVEISWDQLKQDSSKSRLESALEINEKGVRFAIRKYVPVNDI